MHLQLCPRLGSKRYQLKQLYSAFPEHDHYVEPFGGAFSVLLNKPRSEMESINDLDDGLVAIAFTYLYPDLRKKLINEVLGKDINCRELFNFLKHWEPVDIFEKAVRKLYLVYHSFSSNERNHGYEINMRLGRKKANNLTIAITPEVIEKIAQRLRFVQIFNEDYRAFIDRFIDIRNGFFYLDPPYTLGTRDDYYAFSFTDQQHEELRKYIDKINARGQKFLLSYHDNDTIKEMYRGYDINYLEVYYATKRANGHTKELLIANYDITKVKKRKVVNSIATFF